MRETGVVRRLSVAVLVDGTYQPNAEGVEEYTPRSEAELDKIAALVQSAVGYDIGRGDSLEVVNMQFADIEVSDTPYDNTLFGFDKNKLLDAAEVLTVAIMIILVILLIIQPMVGRVLTVEGTKGDEDEEGKPELDLLTGELKPALAAPVDTSNMTEEEIAMLEENNEGLIDVESVQGKVKASSVKKIEDIVENYPAETVSVIRSWMAED